MSSSLAPMPTLQSNQQRMPIKTSLVIRHTKSWTFDTRFVRFADGLGSDVDDGAAREPGDGAGELHEAGELEGRGDVLGEPAQPTHQARFAS